MTALPTVVFAHGHGSEPSAIYEQGARLEAFSDAGVLLILPAGQSAPESPGKHVGEHRDEVAFIEEVLDHAAGRWAMDGQRVYASGFSAGGASAVLFGCESARFAATAPISGGWWDPLPTACPAGPIPVMRTQGLQDEVWPVDGRRFSEAFGQADMWASMAFWREVNGASDHGEVWTEDEVWLQQWSDGTAPVRVRLHPEGHTLVADWVPDTVGWLLRFSGR